MTDSTYAQTRRSEPSQGEFIALIAMLFATIALSIDAMLPALTEIGLTMTPDAPNRAQLVIGLFFLGMGIGTIFVGPLSDAFGRKKVILFSGVIYVIGAAICYVADSFELLLAARILQGVGAAGPRAVSMAMVRDRYKGREMARIMSVAMMVFMLVPAIAPLMGQAVMSVSGWHTIFLVYILFAVSTLSWLSIRQPETLPLDHRVPLSGHTLWTSMKDLFSRRVVILAVIAQGTTMAVMISMISSIQPVFEFHFQMADSFPLWFAVLAGLAAFGSFVNAKLVVRLGMRMLATRAFQVFLAMTLIHLALRLSFDLHGAVDFAVFFLWAVSAFFMMTLSMGNLNAIAMEPVGHIAGFAASMTAAAATVLSVILAAPIGQAFDGTPLPLVLGAGVLISLSLLMMRLLRP